MALLEWLGWHYGMILLSIVMYVMPSALLLWTLYVVYRRGNFRNLWLLMIFNVLVFAGNLAVVLNAEQGTFQKVLEASYFAVFVCVYFSIAPIYYSVAMHYFCPELMKAKSNQ